MMVSKRSIFLAAVVLSAASLLIPIAHAADPLMPTGVGGGTPDNGLQPFDPNPSAGGSPTRSFLTYGVDRDGNTVPTKTLRITNNAAVTMYPVMRSPNTGLTTTAPKVSVYDPYDPANMEYRGYIGYKEGTQYYFGLKPGQSILVSLPLVLWNGARIGVGTDGEFLTPAVGQPNPLNYDPNAHRSITVAETSGDTISNGAIMWYRADISKGPADDAEDQLAEWTIRDHAYLSSGQITAASYGEIPDDQLLTLMNYDVSNVDSLYLPLALAANDVWLLPQGTDPGHASDPTHPNLTGGWITGSDPDVFGWTGAINSIEFLQGKIKDFTAGDNKLLGQYFGGKGWPFYNFPNVIVDPSVPIKIPSGANIFPQSPMKGLGDRSSYDNEKYLLSSGGTGKISETIGAAGDQSGLQNNQIRFAPEQPQAKIDFIEVGQVATGNTAGPNPIPPATTVTAIDATNRIVTLSNALVATAVGSSVTCARPKHDYAAEAMIRLWYSWAQYYLAHWTEGTPGAPTSPTPIIASNEAMTATLTFNAPHPELVKGMAVTGPGLDNAQTEVGVHQGNALILEINDDGKSVVLSQVMAPASTNASFTFSPPQALLYTPTTAADPGYPIFGGQLNFAADPSEPWHVPFAFSQQVYLIMASMNQISVANNDNVFKFMQDIVGANMGFILSNPAKLTDDGKMVTSLIRDMIKSVLRGVSDFTKFPDEIVNGEHTVWYPDPTEHRGGQAFNVYNLDPYVRFVHVHLGFSGYGFSVDDDTADVGADGPSHLQLSIAGPGGLKKTDPWFIQAPFGPVRNVTLLYSGPASATNGDSLYYNLANVSNTTPIRITPVAPHGLANGATVVIDSVTGPAANNANGTFKIGNVTKTTFDLFDATTGTVPVVSSGAYTGGGRWGYPRHAYLDTIGASMPGNTLTTVLYRVTGDDSLGTFLGTSISVNGVDRNKNKNGKKFRVWQRGQFVTGRLLLDDDLTDAAGNPLPAGLTANITFFGASEATPTPAPPNVTSTSGSPNAAYVQQLRNRISKAKDIDDPEKRARVLYRLRAWLKIVNRGVDPNSREGQLLRKLVNARTIADPDLRQKTVERIKRQLEKLKE